VPDIHIHRDHSLGLAQARKIAWQWAEEVESRFDMACTVVEGEFSDTVEFTRSGVTGRLIVADDHFDLEARLGFLLGAFSKTIQSQIEQNLDVLLAGAAASTVAKAPGRKPSAKAAKPEKGVATEEADRGEKAEKAERVAKADKAAPAAAKTRRKAV
jgi:putative polyhydroxyalkanoate system protein